MGRASRVLLAAGAALAAAVAGAADPYLGFVYPAAVRTGTKVRLLAGGQHLGSVREAYVSGSGVKAVGFEKVPHFPNPEYHQRRHLQAWLAAIRAGKPQEPKLPPDANAGEWPSNRWWQALDTLDAGKLDLVRRNLYTPKDALQATPSLSEQMLITLDVARTASTGVRFVWLIGDRGISAPRPIVVVNTPVVAEPPFRAPGEPVPTPPCAAAFPSTLVGQIHPGETDAFALDLPAGARFVASVCARELQPCIGDAVPGYFNAVLELRDADGRLVASADDCGFNPDPILVARTTAAGRYLLSIRDNLFRGRGDFGYAIRVSTRGPVPRPIMPYRLAYPELTGLLVATGAVTRAGGHCDYPFEVREPGRYVFEALARREGSALDPVLSLYRGAKAEGRPLAVWDDVTNAVHVGSVLQAECDPIGERALEAGAYTLRVADRAVARGPFYAAVRRPVPSFDVYSVRSAVLLRGKAPARIPLRVVRREGFAGPIRLSASSGFAVSPSEIPAGAKDFTVAVSCAKPKWKVPRPFEIAAEAAGVPPRRVVPADEYEQAFAWKHLLPAPTFVAVVRRPPPKKKPKR